MKTESTITDVEFRKDAVLDVTNTAFIRCSFPPEILVTASGCHFEDCLIAESLAEHLEAEDNHNAVVTIGRLSCEYVGDEEWNEWVEADHA